jgi:hypothetical protein
LVSNGLGFEIRGLRIQGVRFRVRKDVLRVVVSSRVVGAQGLTDASLTGRLDGKPRKRVDIVVLFCAVG